MKTYNISLLIFFTSLTVNLFAQQEWAPIGAKWHYNSTLKASDPLLRFYDVLEATHDSVINGTTYRMVDTIPMLQQGYKVYYYYQGNNHLLYDFNAQLHDTITFELYTFCTLDSSGNQGGIVSLDFKVSNIEHVVIGNDTLQKFTCACISSFDLSYTYEYIENIGSINQFFEDDAGCVYPGIYVSEFLRCYEDDSINYKSDYFTSLGNYACNYGEPTTVEEIEAPDFAVYPNPAEDAITIETSKNLQEVVVIAITGEVLSKQEIRGTTAFDVSSYPSGIYFLQLTNSSGKTSIQKLIVK